VHWELRGGFAGYELADLNAARPQLRARRDQKGSNMARQTTGKKSSRAADEGRHVQAVVDELDKKAKSSPPKKPMQTGQREYPPRFPAQHLEKSGEEAELELAPMYQASGYEGSHKLQDMVALITGGDSGIGRAVAVLFAREGADIAICYLEESHDARTTKAAVELEGRRCILIQGDVSDPRFCNDAVSRTVYDRLRDGH
jgi:short chain dehydrogenase